MSRGGLCGLTKVCTPLFTWIQHSSVQVLMLLPHVLSFPLLYDSTERGSRPPRVLSSSPSEIHTCTAQNIITVGVEITVLYSEKKIECGTLMAGKKKLCFYKAFATRLPLCFAKSEPCFRETEISVGSFHLEKREGDGDFEHFSYFSSPVFDHRAKPPRDLYCAWGGCTNSVYEFLFQR